MLLIDYKPAGFAKQSPINLTRPHILRCTWADLVWAALTTPNPLLPLAIHPNSYPYLELLTRITYLYTYLQAADYRPGLWGAMDTHLVQSPLYRQAGVAEKSTVSTFLGHITAKLFAVKLLQTPCLFAFDPPQFRGLIGLNRQAQWVVLDVKGRSNRLEQRLVKKAVKPAPQVTIGAMPPPHVSFFSYFTAVTKTLKAYLVNHSPVHNAPGPNPKILPATFLRSYYTLLYNFLSADYGGQAKSITFAGHTYRIKEIPEVEAQIGLDERIYHLMQSGEEISLQDFTADKEKVTSPAKEETKITLGLDGTFARLGHAWRDDRMHLSPPRRTL